jgi:hypothetical protein
MGLTSNLLFPLSHCYQSRQPGFIESSGSNATGIELGELRTRQLLVEHDRAVRTIVVQLGHLSYQIHADDANPVEALFFSLNLDATIWRIVMSLARERHPHHLCAEQRPDGIPLAYGARQRREEWHGQGDHGGGAHLHPDREPRIGRPSSLTAHTGKESQPLTGQRTANAT